MKHVYIFLMAVAVISLGVVRVDAQTPVRTSSADSTSVTAGFEAKYVVDGDLNTAFSSGINDKSGITIRFPTKTRIRSVVLYPRTDNGTFSIGFPKSYTLYSVYPPSRPGMPETSYAIQSFTTQPVDGKVVLNLFGTYELQALKIAPTVLGFDDYENNFFQLAEVKVYSELQVVPQVKRYSSNYIPPANKQGVTDWHEPSAARYAVLMNEFGAGINTRNFFWSAAESGVMSSLSPLSCPTGTFMFPASASEKAASGAVKYRCMSSRVVGEFDNYVRQDSSNGLQVAAVVWATPPQYRDTRCQGFINNGQRELNGCVPMDIYEDDFEDYMRFLAYRYRQGSPIGKISHFVIWNEVAAGEWFDYTPIVSNPVTGIVSPIDQSRWVNKYARLMFRASRAIGHNTSGVMMYASIDKRWESSVPRHIGSRNLLERLFRRVGTSFDWSVVVHPYDSPKATIPGEISFLGIRTTLVPFLRSQALAYGGTSYSPQTKVFASEQRKGENLPGSDSDSIWKSQFQEARFVCEAHDEALRTPELIGVTNFYLQARSDVSWDPESYAFLPASVGTNMAGAKGLPTYEAYRSTNRSTWNTSSGHYCCMAHSLGCSSAPKPANRAPLGYLDTASCSRIWGWALDQDAPGASIPVRIYDGDPKAGGRLMTAPTKISRPDVNNALGVSGLNGFEIVNPGLADGRLHRIYAYGVDTYTGQETLLSSAPKNLQCGSANLGSVTLSTDSGWLSGFWNLFDWLWKN